MMNENKNEKEMYPDVLEWFKQLLKDKFSKADITTDITAKLFLNKWLEKKSLNIYFPEYATYECKIDITGFVKTQNKKFLCLIECKTSPITLRDLSQLLGYSKVINPEISILLSPKYVSNSLRLLLKEYSRLEILNYNNNKNIYIGRWNKNRHSIDYESLIPTGPIR